MKLSDKLAALEEEELQRKSADDVAARNARRADDQRVFDALVDRAGYIGEAINEFFGEEDPTKVDPTTVDLVFLTGAVERYEALTLELEQEQECRSAGDSAASNGSGDPLERIPRSRSTSRSHNRRVQSRTRPRRPPEDTGEVEVEPRVVPVSVRSRPGDTERTSSGSRRHTPKQSLTSRVPHFEWICAGLGALFGFIVASTTRGTLHYNGTIGKIVPALWVLAITALVALVCYWIGEAINRESDDG